MCLKTLTYKDLRKAGEEEWKLIHNAAATGASAIPMGSSVLTVANAPTFVSSHQPIIGHRLSLGGSITAGKVASCIQGQSLVSHVAMTGQQLTV